MTGLPAYWRQGSGPESEDIAYFSPTNSTTVPTRYAAIKAWAESNGKKLTAIGYDLVAYNTWADFYFWTGFKVEDGETQTGMFDEYPCPSGCGTTLPAGTGVCPTCNAICSCHQCNVFGLTLYTEVAGDGKGYCRKCVKSCASCDSFLPTGSTFSRCSTCDERLACAGCNTTVSLTDTQERNDRRYCPDCLTRFCDECGTFAQDREPITIEGQARMYCQPCVQEVYAKQRASMEAWSLDEMPVSGNLIIPSSAVRPTRTISIETEFDGNGPEVTRALHHAGLLPSPNREESHTAQPSSLSHPCLMKRDGTVTGGELVTYLLDLDNENHAEALLRMTEVMKGCRDMNFARFSKNAGGHIHIDLHGFTMKDAWAYYTIFQYLQRPLYYIAGAGAEYGHRSVVGGGMAAAPQGGPYGDIRAFALNFPGGRDGLNFGNWKASRRNCSCGAFAAGEWNDCSCNLGKATAEWRLWNAEITPRILHAWIALTEAITAHAQSISESFDEKNFPYLLWEAKELTTAATASIREIKTRLEWMHRELPLTIHERDSIIYACKRSNLNILGDKYLDELLNITNVSAMAAKKKPAPNPASRKDTKFGLKRTSKGNSLTDTQIEALINEGWQISDMTEVAV
jgi:hypothetical protein